VVSERRLNSDRAAWEVTFLDLLSKMESPRFEPSPISPRSRGHRQKRRGRGHQNYQNHREARALSLAQVAVDLKRLMNQVE